MMLVLLCATATKMTSFESLALGFLPSLVVRPGSLYCNPFRSVFGFQLTVMGWMKYLETLMMVALC